jgi:hypothetical protein
VAILAITAIIPAWLLSVAIKTKEVCDVRAHYSNCSALSGGWRSYAGTSQVVGKFKDLDQCKAAAGQQSAGGAISDLSLSRGVYWYCTYTGAR